MANVKPSEFLATLDSHGIYDHDKAVQDYQDATGYKAPWRGVPAARTRAAIKNRGLGGTLRRNARQTCWGYLMAMAVAGALVPTFRSTKLGRGSAFREAIEVLQKAGY